MYHVMAVYADIVTWLRKKISVHQLAAAPSGAVRLAK